MTNIDRVRAALTIIPGGVFTLKSFDTYFNGNGDIGALTRDQLGKAIRSQKTVKVLGNGKYRIRGRKVDV